MQPEDKLGQYRIVALIGAGGMGEVYRACDTHLDRDVALKFLSANYLGDLERVARFRNEARILATLNHPNIAALHAFEEIDGNRFLIMEYVEGEDLARRLARGPIGLVDAIDFAGQFAEGLEYAHERGIVHRDLKPANLGITPDGQLKILDFGLARHTDADSQESESGPDLSTMSIPLTRSGTVVGTSPYMSPEQLTGRRVDQRSDIWAFGAILYEMLSGERLFRGVTRDDTISAVVQGDIDLSRLPARTPLGVRCLLQRCLDRDARRRLRDIGEARVQFERWRELPETMNDPVSLFGTVVRARDRRRLSITWLVAAITTCASLALGWQALRPAPADPVAEWEVDIPGEADIYLASRNTALISPDGAWYGWLTPQGIWVRRADQQGARLLEGTAEAAYASFSPDSRWMVFHARKRLHRIRPDTGEPVPIALMDVCRGVTWVDEQTIVASAGVTAGLKRLDLQSGELVAISQPDQSRGERSHRLPTAVPGRRGVLFECQFAGRDYDTSDIEYLDLDDNRRQLVHKGGAAPRARADGHLLLVRGNTIYAIRLDLKTMTVSGYPVPVRDGVLSSVADEVGHDGSAAYAVDDHGTLFCVNTLVESRLSRLAWLDFADLSIEPFTEAAEFDRTFRIAPDGRRLVASITVNDEPNLFVFDLESGNRALLTTGAGIEHVGAWSPESDRFYWWQLSGGGVGCEIWTGKVDGSDAVMRLTAPIDAVELSVDDVADDGSLLAGSRALPNLDFRIFFLDLSRPAPIEATSWGDAGLGAGIQFLGGGDRFVCSADVSGSRQYFVREYSNAAAVRSLPQASSLFRDGRCCWNDALQGIVGRDDQGFALVSVDQTADAVEIGAPRRFAALTSIPNNGDVSGWDCHPDGKRAVVRVLEPLGSDSQRPTFVVVTGWGGLVARLVRGAGD